MGAHIIKLELGGCRTKGRQNDGPKDMTKKRPAKRRAKRHDKERAGKTTRAKRHDKEKAGKTTGQKT